MKQNLINNIIKPDSPVDVTGVKGSEKAFLASRIFEKISSSMVVVLPTRKEALAFMADYAFFAPDGEDSLLYFPGYNILPFKSLSYHGETAGIRVAALYQLMVQEKKQLLVTFGDTLLQKVMPKNILADSVELVINGDDIDRDQLVARLNSGGYTRSSLVEDPGDYAVRGGILDFFSPGSNHPVRVEFFGDYVESLRIFSPENQRGIREIEEAVVLPASEAVTDKPTMPHLISRLHQAGARAGLDAGRIRGYVEKIREFGRFPGMESMLSIVYPELDSPMSYIPHDALILLDRPHELKTGAAAFESKALDNYNQALSESKLCVEPGAIYSSWDEVEADFTRRNPVSFKELHFEKKDKNRRVFPISVGDNTQLTARLKTMRTQENPLMPLVEWIKEQGALGMTTLMVCHGDIQARRLLSLLSPYGLEPRQVESFTTVFSGKPGLYLTTGRLTSGFTLEQQQLALITDKEIFGGRRSRIRRGKRRVKTSFITPEELKTGDIVVHLEHGLGRYEGLTTITMDGISNDFILITYRDGDRLYLPVDRMELVEKYVGVEGYTPLLDKIGGKTWQKSRAKAKKEVEKMAGDLLKLYAERRVKKGHAFSPSDNFYHDFEASFPHEETPDQLRAIDDVLADMEEDTPMDRLVCGDVGYGKTEVAIRAAFKAVNDGRQVAVVVPTTILAEQHLITFRERFDGYPVEVAALSRFRTRKEQAEILKGLESGRIHVVIGTHRLLQKDIFFKSLGLLVIDEEQRFGVKHKEALKKRRSTVDVLSLTATPIPRTLHMSLTGMRDISVISTPPKDRQAIISYISEYDNSIAREAIQRELVRGGQIFFIHNNIKTIFKTAENLQKLVPEMRLGVAHGRLTEQALEKVMLQFINKEIDTLVCTTIVESGLDIPSANTMIINRADRFGLSQIYQLRGRIGRGDDQAYAYLFVPDENRLSRDAKKRLAALMEHRDLGSGFQIAMKDLQIRGYGSALGASQSGHIAAVGYDMFLKLLDEAVSDLKGRPPVTPLEPEINISMSAYISEEYVQSIEQRLTIYRRLSQMTEVSEISAMQKELVDRFGKLPLEATHMLLKIMLRMLAVQAGIKRMDVKNNTVSLVFSEIHQKKPFGLAGDLPPDLSGARFITRDTLQVPLRIKTSQVTRVLARVKKILTTIASMVN